MIVGFIQKPSTIVLGNNLGGAIQFLAAPEVHTSRFEMIEIFDAIDRHFARAKFGRQIFEGRRWFFHNVLNISA